MRERLRFDGRYVLVRVTVAGPLGQRTFRFALDTGATLTVVDPRALARVGYRDEAQGGLVNVATAGGMVAVRSVQVDSVACLGSSRQRFAILTHQLPDEAKVDGLLGLDFLRNHRLTIDFRAGTIELD